MGMNVGQAPTHNLGPTLVALSTRHLAFFRGPRVWFLLIALAALLGGYVLLGSVEPFDARLMFASGWLWVILGLILASTASDRFALAIRRLQERGVLTRVGDGFIHHLKQQSAEFGPYVGFVIATAVTLMWAFVGRIPSSDISALGLLALVWLVGFAVGFVMARLVAFGAFIPPSLANQDSFVIEVKPGHIDGAAGLKPVGDYYLFQAFLTSIPCIHLGLWILLISFGVATNLDRWLEPYIALLVLAIAFEIGSAGVPLWFFHREMLRQKQKLLLEADRLSHEITDLQERMASGERSRDPTLSEIASKEDRYRSIEKMPTWPFDLADWRKFTAGNLALFTPMVIELVNTRFQELTL
jgi:hypothetical protein